MKKLNSLSKKDKKFYRIIVITFILLCAVISFLCFQYYLRLQDTIKTETHSYMQEIVKQMGANVEKIFTDKYLSLETVASVIRNLNIDSYKQLDNIITEQKNLWHYQELLLIDKNGIAYNNNGQTVAISSDKYLQDVVVSQKPSLSTSQIIDGKESVIFAIPLQNVKIDNKEMLALAASYDLSTFDQILSMTAFGDKGYAHIIGADGTVIIRSSSPNTLPSGYNLLNFLADAKFNDARNIDDIKADIASGRSGQAEFYLDKTHEYMTYTPLGTQQWSLLIFVPVNVINAKSNMMLNITILLCTFITFTFSMLLAILISTFYRNKRELEHIAYVDHITGGNTIDRFYDLAKNLLMVSGKPQYALVYTNIEKFKVLNEQFGRQACNDVLCSIEAGIGLDLCADECMGRLSADNFCILIEYKDEASLLARLNLWYKNETAYMKTIGTPWMPLIMEFGIYIIINSAMPFPQMIDRAKLALNESKGEFNGKIRYAIYDEKMRHILFREKQLEDCMETALNNYEFHVYLQPKYRTQTEIIGGAEALVRWMRPSEGIIFPDDFIPLFEKNGFVIQLDFYMFEEVCKIIRKWLDAGVEPVKISVNCSRLHLKNTDFLTTYTMLADKYCVPHQLLEIELTENTVFGDVEYLSDIIKQIHALGFGCSMDDFGSGYSSLNLIQDIPVDTLKLDKIFFRNTKNLQRNESIIASILTMSKALSMETVAEGVEDKIQVEMLKRLNCDYIQGYFFAKPMPVSDFEQLTFARKIPC